MYFLFATCHIARVVDYFIAMYEIDFASTYIIMVIYLSICFKMYVNLVLVIVVLSFPQSLNQLLTLTFVLTLTLILWLKSSISNANEHLIRRIFSNHCYMGHKIKLKSQN